MQNTTPIACTLTDADLRDRQIAWLKVGAFATKLESVPGGLRYDFATAPGVQESLIELIRLEAECCAWMTFGMESADGVLRLSITGVGDDGERAVRESFGPLSALVRQ